MKQNDYNNAEDPDSQINMLHSRHNNNDDEDTHGVQVDLNEDMVDFRAADQSDIYELLELGRETEDDITNMEKTVQQELKEIKDGSIAQSLGRDN